MALRVEQLLLKPMEQKTISIFVLEVEFFETPHAEFLESISKRAQKREVAKV